MAELVVNVLGWARDAQIGERCTYHKGTAFGKPLGTAGVSARAAHQEGLVFLSQRRGGVDGQTIFYEATRISTPCAVSLKLVERRYA